MYIVSIYYIYIYSYIVYIPNVCVYARVYIVRRLYNTRNTIYAACVCVSVHVYVPLLPLSLSHRVYLGA